MVSWRTSGRTSMALGPMPVPMAMPLPQAWACAAALQFAAILRGGGATAEPFTTAVSDGRGPAEVPTTMYVGERWGSATDGLKCHDWQYWAPIEFDQEGHIQEMSWVDEWWMRGVTEGTAVLKTDDDDPNHQGHGPNAAAAGSGTAGSGAFIRTVQDPASGVWWLQRGEPSAPPRAAGSKTPRADILWSSDRCHVCPHPP